MSDLIIVYGKQDESEKIEQIECNEDSTDCSLIGDHVPDSKPKKTKKLTQM